MAAEPSDRTDRAEFSGLHQNVDAFLRALNAPSTLLVALSGGGDSTALLRLLHHALNHMPHQGHRLCAATVDHGLRPESRAEAEACARLCAALSIPHAILDWVGEKPLTGLQAAARDMRSQLLAAHARRIGADLILTGHTSDDQDETQAMRAARSGGEAGRGLSGMAGAVLIEGSVWLARPLLRTDRHSLRAFLTALGQGWIEDPSNRNRGYERVRVRQDGFDRPGGVITAAERHRQSERIAAHVSRFHLHDQVLGEVDHDPAERVSEDLFAAMLRFQQCLGGRVMPLGGETRARLRAFLADELSGRMSAGRVVWTRKGTRLFLHRERRNLPAFPPSPVLGELWDHRFMLRQPQQGSGSEADPSLANASADRGTANLSGGPPASLLAVAKQTLPQPIAGGHEEWEPWLAPFERYLPLFDWPEATSLRVLFRRRAFPEAPFRASFFL